MTMKAEKPKSRFAELVNLLRLLADNPQLVRDASIENETSMMRGGAHLDQIIRFPNGLKTLTMSFSMPPLKYKKARKRKKK